MSIAASIKSQIVPIHPEGYPFIGGFAFASLILFFKKAAKFVVIAVLAVFAWLRKLITAGRKTQDTSQ